MRHTKPTLDTVNGPRGQLDDRREPRWTTGASPQRKKAQSADLPLKHIHAHIGLNASTCCVHRTFLCTLHFDWRDTASLHVGRRSPSHRIPTRGKYS